MSSLEKDKTRILHILQAIEFIEEFVKNSNAKSFVKDHLVQSAVIRQCEIMGEAAGNISDTLKKKFPEIEWTEIKGLRNLLDS
jgi:uncharacterized protein with HEPN domain